MYRSGALPEERPNATRNASDCGCGNALIVFVIDLHNCCSPA